MILLIETSTDICSVGIAEEGKILVEKTSSEKYSHASRLTLFIEAACQSIDITLQDLKAVAVSIGPGSYTGLRIGLSTAKGTCYALGIPLIAVDTLKGLACKGMQIEPNASYFIPMIDARRMEVYTVLYDQAWEELVPNQAMILDEKSFSEFLNSGKTIVFLGNGAEKCKSLFEKANTIFLNELCAASNLAELAHQKFVQQDFADLAYIEPNYFKPPNITKPRKLL